MGGGGVLFSGEGASRAGSGCCASPLASNFRSNDASTLRAAAIDVATVVLGETNGEWNVSAQQWGKSPTLAKRAWGTRHPLPESDECIF